MTSNRTDAKKMALYRNVSYGIGGASLLTTLYFGYKYLGYSPQFVGFLKYDKLFDVTPMIYTSKDFADNAKARNNEGYYVGWSLAAKF